MHFISPIRVFVIVAGLVTLAACSGGSATEPNPAGRDALRYINIGTSPQTSARVQQHFVSHYSCPATGPLKYVSDFKNNVINVYVGKFAGQAPCGQIASSSLNEPAGLYVQDATHDLYVGNDSGHNVLVFHRGQTDPYNTYTDPSGQFVLDVTTTPDGTVIASNYLQYNGNESGSISTWIGGPNGGTFVGNYPMANGALGGFVTSRKNGKVYFDDVDTTSFLGSVSSISCPAGACGAQTQVAGVSLHYPGGMAVSSTGDLLVNDQAAATADTFEFPDPKPSTFPLTGNPFGLAIDNNSHHWFVADGSRNVASEYYYPSGKLVGTVPGNFKGGTTGIAVDP